MFDFLKNLVAPKAAPAPRPVNRSSRSRKPVQHDPGEPSALPDVVEGNEQTDWALWHDSVNSQLQPISRSHADSQFQDTTSQLDELDPFSRVGKNRDV